MRLLLLCTGSKENPDLLAPSSFTLSSRADHVSRSTHKNRVSLHGRISGNRCADLRRSVKPLYRRSAIGLLRAPYENLSLFPKIWTGRELRLRGTLP